jgi:DNA-binding NtrC family response regulator
MVERVLFVDDDRNLLRGYARLLGRRFAVTSACGGHEGLEVLRRQGPFAVVVADKRMPLMDGDSFFAQLEALAPKAVRIMLTGDSDQGTAEQAVKEGRIFRYLVKPCPHDLLVAALEDGLRQFRSTTSGLGPRGGGMLEGGEPEGVRHTAAVERTGSQGSRWGILVGRIRRWLQRLPTSAHGGDEHRAV